MTDTTAGASALRPEGAEIEEESRRAAMQGEPPFKRPRMGADDRTAALKDAAVAAIIAYALLAPFIGLFSDIGGGRLAVTERSIALFLLVTGIFVGRLLLNLYLWDPASPLRAAGVNVRDRLAGAGAGPLAMLAGHGLLIVVVLGVAFAVVLPFLPFANRYVVDQATSVLTYVMLGWGLNIVVGFAGLLDLGYVAFFAVGAYSFALLAQHYDLGFWLCLPLAGVVAAAWGVALGFPVLRLRGDYLAVVTLAFGEIIHLVLINWKTFTGGPDGLLNIPRPTLFGIPFERGEGGFAETFGIDFSTLQRPMFLYYVILVLALITAYATNRLRQMPVGRAWEALREDEIACRSLGINTVTTKLSAFAIGAMFAGFAGAFFATRLGSITPESFKAEESFRILASVVLGGLGSQVGVVIAVIFISVVIELRALSTYRMLIVGLSMVGIMVWKPRGLISTRRPTVFLKRRRTIAADMVGQGRG